MASLRAKLCLRNLNSVGERSTFIPRLYSVVNLISFRAGFVFSVSFTSLATLSDLAAMFRNVLGFIIIRNAQKVYCVDVSNSFVSIRDIVASNFIDILYHDTIAYFPIDM